MAQYEVVHKVVIEYIRTIEASSKAGAIEIAEDLGDRDAPRDRVEDKGYKATKLG